MFKFEILMTEVQRAVSEAVAECARASQRGVASLAWHAAEDSRNTHPYKNRTGDLEESTQSIEGSRPLEARVVARTPYASVVEAMPGYRYLQPSVDRVVREQTGRVGEEIAQAMQRAIDRRGLADSP